MLPFVWILIGITARTILPYVRVVVITMRDQGEFPRFEPKFWIAPLGALLADLVFFGLSLILDAEWLDQILMMDWRIAVITGIGGQEILREIQKWFEKPNPE